MNNVPYRISTYDKHKIIVLKEQGLSVTDIANELGITGGVGGAGAARAAGAERVAAAALAARRPRAPHAPARRALPARAAAALAGRQAQPAAARARPAGLRRAARAGAVGQRDRGAGDGRAARAAAPARPAAGAQPPAPPARRRLRAHARPASAEPGGQPHRAHRPGGLRAAHQAGGPERGQQRVPVAAGGRAAAPAAPEGAQQPQPAPLPPARAAAAHTDAGAVLRVPLLRVPAADGGARGGGRAGPALRPGDPAAAARGRRRLGQRHRPLGAVLERVGARRGAGGRGAGGRGAGGRGAGGRAAVGGRAAGARGAAPRVVPAAAGAVPAVRGPVRLVDAALRRVGRLPAGAAGQRHRGVRAGVQPQPHRRAALPRHQPGGRRLLHGHLPGVPGGGGRGHAGRVPRARHRLADVGRLQAGGLPGRAVLRAVGVHAGGDHAGAQLRHHARHAPQQAAVAAARGGRHGGGLGLLADGGRAAAAGRVRLPQVRSVPALRDRHPRRARLRRHAAGHQRRGLPRAAGLLPQDVLRHPRLAGLELQRLAHRQAHGAARVHRLPLLVAHRLLRADGGLRRPARVARGGQSVHGVRAAAQLVLQPLPVRHPHQAVQEGLRARVQGHRGVARDARHRPLPTLVQLQQPPDARQHQQPGGAVVARAARRRVRVPAPAARAARAAAAPPAGLAARVRPPLSTRARARAARARHGAQARRLRVLVRGVLVVALGLVARLRAAAAAASPRRVVAGGAQDVAGLQPVVVAQRLVGLGGHGVDGHVAHVALGRQRAGAGAAAADAPARRVGRVAARIAGAGRAAPAHHPVGRGDGAAARRGSPARLTPRRPLPRPAARCPQTIHDVLKTIYFVQYYGVSA